ncbi:MAG: hypothetical protein LBM70_02415 [Victivallales bacterium]|jgi:hypothetical protein|nr:hypothetical protein [Victivallales bacterium]
MLIIYGYSHEFMGSDHSTELPTGGGSAPTSWMTHSRLSRRLWITLDFRQNHAVTFPENNGNIRYFF